MKKSTWLLGLILFIFKITIVGLGIAHNSNLNNNDGILNFIFFWAVYISIIIFPIIAIIVAWEQNNYIWLTTSGLIYLLNLPGASFSAVLSLAIPPIFLIIRFRSWKDFFRKLRYHGHRRASHT